MINRICADVKRYFNYTVISARCDLMAEVASSYLNWVWWILEPFCMMLIYAFVFGYVFGSKEKYFAVFIFIGLTMWNFFNHVISGSVKIVKANKGIVTKVYIPKYMLLIQKIWVNGFKMVVSFGVVGLMLIFFRIPVTFSILMFLPILLLHVLFTFAIATFLLHLGVFVEDLTNVTTIVLRFLMYMTGIFYSVEKKIPVVGYYLSRFNPLAYIISAMREILIYKKMPELRYYFLWLAVSLVLAYLGVRNIYKNENSYVKSI